MDAHPVSETPVSEPNESTEEAIGPSDDARPWYVVHTRPRKELLVTSLLEEDRVLEVFLPQVTQTRRGKDGARTEMQPLFPGYLFVRPNPKETDPDESDKAALNPRTINRTPGVVRVVALGDQPQPMDAAVVDAIRQQVEKLDDQGGLPQHPYKPGDPVRLTRGPLQGLEAVFQGPMKPIQRVQVLLEFLGQQQTVDVDVEDLEQSAAPPPARRERRTRGKGRRIKRT